MKLVRYQIFVLSIFLLLAVGLFPAQTFAVGPVACTWIGGSANWTASTANWSCGAIPNDNTYDVTINEEIEFISTIILSSNITIGRLTLGSFGAGGTSISAVSFDGGNLTIDDAQGWDGAGDLRFGSASMISNGGGGGTISLDGDWEGNIDADGTAPSFDSGSNIMVTLTGGNHTNQNIENTGVGAISTANLFTFYNLTLAPTGATTTIGTNTSTLVVSNLLTANGGGIMASSTLSTKSTINLTSDTVATPFVANSSYFATVPFNYTDCTLSTKNIAAGTYSALTINPATPISCVTATSTLLGNVTVAGNLTLRGGGMTPSTTHTLNTGGYNLTVQGNTYLGHTRLSDYYPARIYATGNSTLSFYNVSPGYSTCTTGTCTSTEGGIWVNNGNPISISGDLDFGDHYAQGNGLSVPFHAGTSTVTFNNATTSQIVNLNGSSSFYNLVINNTAPDGSNSVKFYDNLDVDNTLTLTDGALDLITSNKALTIGANMSIGNTASTSILRGSNSNTTFDGTSIFTDLSNVFDLGNVFIASSTAAATLTLASNATSTYLNVGTGETLNSSSYTLNLTNTTSTTTPLVVNGTFTPGTGTIKYKGASSIIAPTVYYNLNTENAGKAYTVSASSTVANNLTNTAGTLLLSSGTTTVLGTITNSDTIIENTGILSKPATSASLDASSYIAGDTLTISVDDQDGNLVGTSTQTLGGATTTISSGVDSEIVTLTETGIATHIFTGTLLTSSTTVGSINNGTLYIPSAGTITLTYVDPQDSSDNSAVDTASIVVDVNAPTTSTLSPTDGATGVGVNSNLVVTFSEAVDVKAGALNDITIKKSSDDTTVETIDAQDAKVTGSGGTTITINPATTLAGETGYYVLIGADAFDDLAGNSYAGISATTSWNFTTADIAAPTFSSITATPNAETPSITWTTNEAASSIVDYGLTDAYGNSTTETDTAPRVTSHSQSITGLTNCTTYHYRVRSKDSSLNEGTSSDTTLTTSGCAAGSGTTTTNTIGSVTLPLPLPLYANTTTPQTNTNPETPTQSSDPLSSIRKEITPIIATLFTGPIYTNRTDTQNRILQFLLAGDPSIYPEGQITGYYGPLTKAAVKRFQLKYNITTVDNPFYGYAGPATREKIREVLGR